MYDAITDVPGIEVGHAQNLEAGTGCTVVIARAGAVPAGDVRGGGPATRETDCLAPECMIERAHAVYLGGGSAFGLAGATGVMQYLEEQGIGYDIGVTHVPVVPGACVIDLTVGDHRIRPDAAMGYEACRRASSGVVEQGNVGAGTGATIGPKSMPKRLMKSGIGSASRTIGELIVGAIVVVNSFGDIIDPQTGETLAGLLNEAGDGFAGAVRFLELVRPGASAFTANTTIGVVATNARLTKAHARRVAMMAHDGFARAIVPIHTHWDGDTVFCLATGGVEAEATLVGAVAVEVVSRAIVRSVLRAESRYGVPSCREIRERWKG